MWNGRQRQPASRSPGSRCRTRSPFRNLLRLSCLLQVLAQKKGRPGTAEGPGSGAPLDFAAFGRLMTAADAAALSLERLASIQLRTEVIRDLGREEVVQENEPTVVREPAKARDRGAPPRVPNPPAAPNPPPAPTPTPTPIRPKAPPAPAAPAGPFSAVDRARAELKRVRDPENGATSAQIKDAELRFIRATEAAERALRKMAGVPERVPAPPKFRPDELKVPQGTAQRVERARAAVERAEKGGSEAQRFDAREEVRRAEEAHRRVVSPQRREERPTGPFGALEVARRDLVKVQDAGGGGTALRDAELRLKKAEKTARSAQRDLEPQGAGNSIRELVRSTRYGISPNGRFEAMPLVGRTIDAAMKGGPFGIALTATAAALMTLHDAADATASRVNEFAQAQYTSGGTPEEAAALRGIGGAVGLSGQDVAQMARQFREQISGSNPWAQAYFNQVDLGDKMGKTDVAQELLQAVEHLRDVYQHGPGTPDDRMSKVIQEARAGSIEQLIPYVRLPEEDVQRIFSDAEKASHDYAKAAEDSAERFRVSSSRLSSAVGDFLTHQTQPVVSAGASVQNKVADAIRNQADIDIKERDRRAMSPYQGHPMSQKDAFIESLRLLVSPIYTFPDAKADKDAQKGAPPAETDKDTGTDHVDRNTQAIENSTTMLLQNQRLVFGGGPMAHGAVPAAWRGELLNQAAGTWAGPDLNARLKAQGYTQGAFAA